MRITCAAGRRHLATVIVRLTWRAKSPSVPNHPGIHDTRTAVAGNTTLALVHFWNDQAPCYFVTASIHLFHSSMFAYVMLRSSHHRCRRSRHDHESGTESDSSRKRCSSHRRRHKCCDKLGSSYKLVDSEQQWLDIQKKQTESAAYQTPRSAVLRDLSTAHRHISGYTNSGHESDTEMHSSTLNRAKRKQHSRSLSENGRHAREILAREMKKHIDFNLAEPQDVDKHDIRYTQVE